MTTIETTPLQALLAEHAAVVAERDALAGFIQKLHGQWRVDGILQGINPEVIAAQKEAESHE